MAELRNLTPKEAIAKIKELLAEPDTLKQLNEIGGGIDEQFIELMQTADDMDDAESKAQLHNLRASLIEKLGLHKIIHSFWESIKSEIPVDPMTATFVFTLAIRACIRSPEWAMEMDRMLSEEEIGGYTEENTMVLLDMIFERFPVVVHHEPQGEEEPNAQD